MDDEETGCGIVREQERRSEREVARGRGVRAQRRLDQLDLPRAATEAAEERSEQASGERRPIARNAPECRFAQ